MSAGNPQTMNDWNYRSGSLAVQLEETLHLSAVVSSATGAITDAGLIARGFVEADINTLRSAIGDANDLATIFGGGTSIHLTGTYDYTTFVKLLYGVQ